VRILHVTPYYAQAWAYGGIPRVVSILAAGQARRGHQVTVCTTDACDARSRLARPEASRPLGPWPRSIADGVELRIFPNLSNAAAYHLQAFMPLAMPRYLRRKARDFDVAHVHGCHNLPGIWAADGCRRAGVPYVLSPHGTAPLIERRRAAKWLLRVILGRRVIPDAARLIATTEAERFQLLALGADRERISVVPNPISAAELDQPTVRGAFRARFGVPWKELVVYLGRMSPRKRLDVLISAFALLDRPNAGLVLAGNDMGSEAGLRRLIEQKGIGQRTLFTGLLRGRERIEALADADVVAYPGRHEIFGLVPIEALGCGSPVVVAGDSGCGEVVRATGGGLVVPEGDPVALSRALATVLENPIDWRAAARRAGVSVGQRFAEAAIGAQLESVYQAARTTAYGVSSP
jgi:glycosyltransferase involved in cell wall biosynthesis